MHSCNSDRRTFGLRVQALVGPEVWVGVAVTGDDGGVAGRRSLGDARKRVVAAVHVEQTEPLSEACGPLKVIHEGPGGVAPHVHPVQHASWGDTLLHFNNSATLVELIKGASTMRACSKYSLRTLSTIFVLTLIRVR